MVCPLICDHAPMYVCTYWCSLSCSYVGGVVWTLCILTVHCVNWLRSWFTFNSYCLCRIIPTDMGYPIKCPFSFTPWCASQWLPGKPPCHPGFTATIGHPAPRTNMMFCFCSDQHCIRLCDGNMLGDRQVLQKDNVTNVTTQK